MKTAKIKAVLALALCGALTTATIFLVKGQPSPANATALLGIEGLRPVGTVAANDPATEQLISLFATASTASASITPGPNATAQRRAVDDALRSQLEIFLTNYEASAWAPSVNLLLGRRSLMRCGYTSAMNHFLNAFAAVQGSSDPNANIIAVGASGGLAKLLALTGKIAALDSLESQANTLGLPLASPDWRWAFEMRTWVAKHPNDSFKCGLFCLDQLGRRTQPGQFIPASINEVNWSTDGYTAADLLNIGAKAGLRVHAALLSSFDNIPVPCVLHLNCEHFIVVREQSGVFYDVFDPVAEGPRWLTAPEIAQEASGCVIVSDAVPPGTYSGSGLTVIDATAAAAYRGRCHNTPPPDHEDSPCVPRPGVCCVVPGRGGAGGPGGPGGPGGSGGSGGAGGAGGPGGLGPSANNVGGSGGSGAGSEHSDMVPAQGCSSCELVQPGMAQWFVSEPYLNGLAH